MFVYLGVEIPSCGKQLNIFVVVLVVLLQFEGLTGKNTIKHNSREDISAKKETKSDVFGAGGITHRDSFNEAVLGVHNEYRQVHHSQHLYLDPKLTENAQKHAKELSIRGISQLGHSQGYKNKKYGENIFASCGTHVLPDVPVKHWYSKVCNYDFLAHAAKTEISPVKDFTQIVWRGTEKMGVGRATSYHEKPCTYIVAQYLPRYNPTPTVRRGNVDIGDFNKEICKDLSYVGFGARG